MPEDSEFRELANLKLVLRLPMRPTHIRLSQRGGEISEAPELSRAKRCQVSPRFWAAIYDRRKLDLKRPIKGTPCSGFIIDIAKRDPIA